MTGRISKLPLFAMGSNKYLMVKNNRLFLAGNDSNSHLPPFFTMIDCGEKTISWVGAYLDTYFFITDEGEVWGWGHPNDFSLGEKFGNQPVLKPQRLNPSEIAIKTLSTTFGHTLYLDIHGNVYGSGENSYAQLGVHTLGIHDFFCLNFPEKVAQIATSLLCSYILTDKGTLFGCGFNEYGELGLNHKKPATKFVPINFPKSIYKIVTTIFSTYLITEDGEIYASGEIQTFL